MTEFLLPLFDAYISSLPRFFLHPFTISLLSLSAFTGIFLALRRAFRGF